MEEGNDESLKLLLESRGDSTCPEKGWSPVGSESCVALRRPLPRSVDSECVGRVTEPREWVYPRGPTVRISRKATSAHHTDLVTRTSPGSLEQGMQTRTPQEPGRPRHLHGKEPGREPAEILVGRDASLPGPHCQATHRGTAERRKRSEAGRSSRNRSEP